MTIQDLKTLIENLPKEAIVLISANDISDIETVHVQYHSDGRVHVILSDED